MLALWQRIIPTPCGDQPAPKKALIATHKRIAAKAQRPYYQSILIKLLEDHHIFVATAAVAERTLVSQQIRSSLGLLGTDLSRE